MEQEKKTAGMPCPPCKSAPFSRAVKPAAQENAVQEAAAPLGAVSYTHLTLPTILLV